MGLDLDNSDVAFEHVSHSHVRFELKDEPGTAEATDKKKRSQNSWGGDGSKKMGGG